MNKNLSSHHGKMQEKERTIKKQYIKILRCKAALLNLAIFLSLWECKFTFFITNKTKISGHDGPKRQIFMKKALQGLQNTHYPTANKKCDTMPNCEFESGKNE